MIVTFWAIWSLLEPSGSSLPKQTTVLNHFCRALQTEQTSLKFLAPAKCVITLLSYLAQRLGKQINMRFRRRKALSLFNHRCPVHTHTDM